MTSCINTIVALSDTSTTAGVADTGGDRVSATCEEVEDPYVPIEEEETRRAVVRQGDGCSSSQRYTTAPATQDPLASGLGPVVIDYLPEDEVNQNLDSQAGFVTTLQDGDRLVKTAVRTRTVLNPGFIRDNDYHVQLLYIVEIVVDCEVGPWSEWVTSGTTRTRSRPVSVQPSEYGRECPELEQTAEVDACVVSDWSDWMAVAGDDTMRVRTRVVTEAGTACPTLQQRQDIVDCAVGAWGPYAYDPIIEELVRSRPVVTAPSPLGSICPHLVEQVSVQDCRVGAWGSWTVDPGDATMQLRVRGVEQQPSVFGEQCVELEETKLIVDCVVSAWEPWEADPDDATMEVRERSIDTQPTELGTPCPQTSETRVVGDCELGDWGDWAVDAGDSTMQLRSRSVIASTSGTPCTDPGAPLLDRKPLVDCVVGAWGAWVLDPSDNTKELRVRPVTREPSEVGAACGDLSETQPVVDCVVGAWGAWSQDTDPTLQVRTRLIDTDATRFGEQCPPTSELTETLPLVECGLSDWFAWSALSGAVQTRNRIVTQSPSEAAGACEETTETCTYSWSGTWSNIGDGTEQTRPVAGAPTATTSGDPCPFNAVEDTCTYGWGTWSGDKTQTRTRTAATASVSGVTCPENGMLDTCVYGDWSDVGTPVADGQQQPQTRSIDSRTVAVTGGGTVPGNTNECTNDRRTVRNVCMYETGWSDFSAIVNNEKTRTRRKTGGNDACTATTDTCTYRWGTWSVPDGAADGRQVRPREAIGTASVSGDICLPGTTQDECDYSWNSWSAIGDGKSHFRNSALDTASVSGTLCPLFNQRETCTYTWSLWSGDMTQTRSRSDATAEHSNVPCPENGMIETCVYDEWEDSGTLVADGQQQPQTRTAISRTLATAGDDVTDNAAAVCTETTRMIMNTCEYERSWSVFSDISNNVKTRTRQKTGGNDACTETTDTCTYTWQTWSQPDGAADGRQQRSSQAPGTADVSNEQCPQETGVDVCTYDWETWSAIGVSDTHTRLETASRTATLSGANCDLSGQTDTCTYRWGSWTVSGLTETRVRVATGTGPVSNAACPETGMTDTCTYSQWRDVAPIVDAGQQQDQMRTVSTRIIVTAEGDEDGDKTACVETTRRITKPDCEYAQTWSVFSEISNDVKTRTRTEATGDPSCTATTDTCTYAWEVTWSDPTGPNSDQVRSRMAIGPADVSGDPCPPDTTTQDECTYSWSGTWSNIEDGTEQTRPVTGASIASESGDPCPLNAEVDTCAYEWDTWSGDKTQTRIRLAATALLSGVSCPENGMMDTCVYGDWSDIDPLVADGQQQPQTRPIVSRTVAVTGGGTVNGNTNECKNVGRTITNICTYEDTWPATFDPIDNSNNKRTRTRQKTGGNAACADEITDTCTYTWGEWSDPITTSSLQRRPRAPDGTADISGIDCPSETSQDACTYSWPTWQNIEDGTVQTRRLAQSTTAIPSGDECPIKAGTEDTCTYGWTEWTGDTMTQTRRRTDVMSTISRLPCVENGMLDTCVYDEWKDTGTPVADGQQQTQGRTAVSRTLAWRFGFVSNPDLTACDETTRMVTNNCEYEDDWSDYSPISNNVKTRTRQKTGGNDACTATTDTCMYTWGTWSVPDGADDGSQERSRAANGPADVSREPCPAEMDPDECTYTWETWSAIGMGDTHTRSADSPTASLSGDPCDLSGQTDTCTYRWGSWTVSGLTETRVRETTGTGPVSNVACPETSMTDTCTYDQWVDTGTPVAAGELQDQMRTVSSRVIVTTRGDVDGDQTACMERTRTIRKADCNYADEWPAEFEPIDNSNNKRIRMRTESTGDASCTATTDTCTYEWGTWSDPMGGNSRQSRSRTATGTGTADLSGVPCPPETTQDECTYTWDTWSAIGDSSEQTRTVMGAPTASPSGDPCDLNTDVDTCTYGWGEWSGDMMTRMRTRTSVTSTVSLLECPENNRIETCEYGDWVDSSAVQAGQVQQTRPVVSRSLATATGPVTDNKAACVETDRTLTINCNYADWSVYSAINNNVKTRTRLLTTGDVARCTELTDTCTYTWEVTWSDPTGPNSNQVRSRAAPGRTDVSNELCPTEIAQDECTYTWDTWSAIGDGTEQTRTVTDSPVASMSGVDCPLNAEVDTCTYGWGEWSGEMMTRTRTRTAVMSSDSLLDCPENEMIETCVYREWEDFGTLVADGQQQEQRRTVVSRTLATAGDDVTDNAAAVCTETTRMITNDCEYENDWSDYSPISDSVKTRMRQRTGGNDACTETVDTCTYSWQTWSQPDGAADGRQQRLSQAPGTADVSGEDCLPETGVDVCTYTWGDWSAIGVSDTHTRLETGSPTATLSGVDCDLNGQTDTCMYEWGTWSVSDLTETRIRETATGPVSNVACPETGMVDTCVYEQWMDIGTPVAEGQQQDQTRTVVSRTLATTGDDVTDNAASACTETTRMITNVCEYGDWGFFAVISSDDERIRTRQKTGGNASCVETITDTCTYTWEEWSDPIRDPGFGLTRSRTTAAPGSADVSGDACPDPGAYDECLYTWNSWTEIGAGNSHTRALTGTDTSSAAGVPCPPLNEQTDECAYEWGPWVAIGLTDVRMRQPASASVSMDDCPENGNTDTCVYGEWTDEGMVSAGVQEQVRLLESRTVVTEAGSVTDPATVTPDTGCDRLTRSLTVDACVIAWGEWELDPADAAQEFRDGDITVDSSNCPLRKSDDSTKARDSRLAGSDFVNVVETSDNCQYVWGPWTQAGSSYRRELIVIREARGTGTACPSSPETMDDAPSTVTNPYDFGCNIPYQGGVYAPGVCVGSYPGGKELLAIDYEGSTRIKIAYSTNGDFAINRFVLEQNMRAEDALTVLGVDTSRTALAGTTVYDNSLLVLHSTPDMFRTDGDYLGFLQERDIVFLMKNPASGSFSDNQGRVKDAVDARRLIFAGGLYSDGVTPAQFGCRSLLSVVEGRCILAHVNVVDERADSINTDASNPLAIVASAISQIARVFNLDHNDAIEVMFAVADKTSCTAGDSCGAGILDVTKLFDERGLVKAVLGGDDEKVVVGVVVPGCEYGAWGRFPAPITQIRIRTRSVTAGDEADCTVTTDTCTFTWGEWLVPIADDEEFVQERYSEEEYVRADVSGEVCLIAGYELCYYYPVEWSAIGAGNSHTRAVSDVPEFSSDAGVPCPLNGQTEECTYEWGEWVASGVTDVRRRQPASSTVFMDDCPENGNTDTCVYSAWTNEGPPSAGMQNQMRSFESRTVETEGGPLTNPATVAPDTGCDRLTRSIAATAMALASEAADSDFVNVDETSDNCQYVWGPWTQDGGSYRRELIVLREARDSGIACPSSPETMDDAPDTVANPYDFGCGVAHPDQAAYPGGCAGSYPGGKELQAIDHDDEGGIKIAYSTNGGFAINKFVLDQNVASTTALTVFGADASRTALAATDGYDNSLLVSHGVPDMFLSDSGYLGFLQERDIVFLMTSPSSSDFVDDQDKVKDAVDARRLIFAGGLLPDGVTPSQLGCSSVLSVGEERCVLAYEAVVDERDGSVNTDASNPLALVASAVAQIARVFNLDHNDAIEVMFAVADKTSCTAGDSCGAGILDVTKLFDQRGRVKAVLGGGDMKIVIPSEQGSDSPVGTSEQKEEIEYEHDLYELGYISLPGLKGDVSVMATNHYVGTPFNLVTSSRTTQANFDLADTDLRVFGKQEGFGFAMSRDSIGYCRAGICSYVSDDGEVGVKHFVAEGFEYSVSYKKTDDFFGGEATGSLGFGKTDSLIAGMRYRYDIGNNLGLSLGADFVHGRAGDGRLLRDLQGTLLRPNLELKHKASLTSGAKRTITFDLQQKDFVGSFNVPDAKHKLRENDWEVNLSLEYRY